MIPVSEPFLPAKSEYISLISEIWDRKYLTNNGPFVQKLEGNLQDYLGVNSLSFVSNGTMAIQLAIQALQIKGEVITTPFSFVATTTSILWENCQPVFVDINPNTLCIDAEKIEEAITEDTEAILATHVYGIPCDVEKIQQIAEKYQLKVIYDAAHAFGVSYKGETLLKYGDISTLSFHATKLYHTTEGGGIVNNKGLDIEERIRLLRNFGFKDGNPHLAGINAKNSEFHAAMGLCNLKYIDDIIKRRKKLTELYDSLLLDVIKRPTFSNEVEYNYIYYPVIFDNEKELIEIKNALENEQIQTRRYFYPSLNKLSYLSNKTKCEVSEDISKRVLCLPLFYDLKLEQVERISQLIMERMK